jgi:hypothetical protein
MAANQDFFSRKLPKWPACFIIGKPVSLLQAMEILVRTDPWTIFTNDREWEAQIREITGIPEYRPDSTSDRFQALADQIEAEERFREKYGVLPLDYLTNERIYSSHVDGCNGWCDWNGRIYLETNIGKWPSVREVFEEWRSIAQVFSYLDLKCQLFDAECGMYSRPRPVVQYNLSGGKVEMVEPEEGLSSRISEVEVQSGEPTTNPWRGCSPEKLKEALNWAQGQVLWNSL